MHHPRRRGHAPLSPRARRLYGPLVRRRKPLSVSAASLLVGAIALAPTTTGAARGGDGGPAPPASDEPASADDAPPLTDLPPDTDLAPNHLAPPTAQPDFWRAELLLALQPDQTRSVSCGRGLDCLTPARSFLAAAMHGRFERPGAWWAALTMSLGRAEDHERVPTDGYGVFTLRADLQVELGRTAERLGVALRVSPTLIVGWSGAGAGVRTDLPAFAFLLGLRDLWGEVGLPSVPTHADPRLFFVQLGWRQPHFELAAGLATFGSLGYREDAIHKVGGGFGLWLSGRGRLTPTSPWEATLRLAIANPTILLLGIAWRAPPPTPPH